MQQRGRNRAQSLSLVNNHQFNQSKSSFPALSLSLSLYFQVLNKQLVVKTTHHEKSLLPARHGQRARVPESDGQEAEFRRHFFGSSTFDDGEGQVTKTTKQSMRSSLSSARFPEHRDSRAALELCEKSRYQGRRDAKSRPDGLSLEEAKNRESI